MYKYIVDRFSKCWGH